MTEKPTQMHRQTMLLACQLVGLSSENSKQLVNSSACQLVNFFKKNNGKETMEKD